MPEPIEVTAWRCAVCRREFGDYVYAARCCPGVVTHPPTLDEWRIRYARLADARLAMRDVVDHLGPTIRAARIERGVTLDQLAVAVVCDKPHLSRVERKLVPIGEDLAIRLLFWLITGQLCDECGGWLTAAELADAHHPGTSVTHARCCPEAVCS